MPLPSVLPPRKINKKTAYPWNCQRWASEDSRDWHEVDEATLALHADADLYTGELFAGLFTNGLEEGGQNVVFIWECVVMQVNRESVPGVVD